MDVRLRVCAVARADRADGDALADDCALQDRDGAEVRDRDRVPVGRRDRHRLARVRDRAGERHRAALGCGHRRAERPGDVDAAMLPARVRMRLVEIELLEDVAARGPCPGLRQGRGDERGQGRKEEQDTHRHHLRCLG
ncbi:MAG TPA: hypothetical protein VHV52_00865 [Gaiellaceae bacterium]|nr:hypothetical protein [Gaiellaceae bacterium]